MNPPAELDRKAPPDGRCSSCVRFGPGQSEELGYPARGHNHISVCDRI